MLPRQAQAPYHLTIPLALLCFSYFLGRVLCCCLGWTFVHSPATYASLYVRFTGTHHHTWHVGRNRSKFLPRLALNLSPLNIHFPSAIDEPLTSF
jgi:hypothetical protein